MQRCRTRRYLTLRGSMVPGASDVGPGATITLLDNVGTLALTGSNAVNQTFCRVTIIVPNDNGTFTPSAINIEIWLPETSWNQRYEGVGGGGFAGTISAKASVQSTPTGLVNALNAGYATASTDTGHPSSAGGAFVLNANDSINYMAPDNRLLQPLAARVGASGRNTSSSSSMEQSRSTHIGTAARPAAARDSLRHRTTPTTMTAFGQGRPRSTSIVCQTPRSGRRS